VYIYTHSVTYLQKNNVNKIVNYIFGSSTVPDTVVAPVSFAAHGGFILIIPVPDSEVLFPVESYDRGELSDVTKVAQEICCRAGMQSFTMLFALHTSLLVFISKALYGLSPPHLSFPVPFGEEIFHFQPAHYTVSWKKKASFYVAVLLLGLTQ